MNNHERNQQIADYWSSINNSDNFSQVVYWLANPIIHLSIGIAKQKAEKDLPSHFAIIVAKPK